MKKFEVWEEGYAATGESGTATKCGTFETETFDEAVEKYLEMKPYLRQYYRKEKRYKSGVNDGKSETVHFILGCRLFDNESDARKSFG